MTEYLFPRRLSRRDFLGTAGALAVAGAGAVRAAEPVVLGTGQHRFTLDESWGQLPTGMRYGLGCAVVVDGQDRVFVTSRSANPCVAIFDRGGRLLETWSRDFAGKVGFERPEQVAATAHGLYWSREGNGEFLYWTENVSGGQNNNPRIGARVYKTDLTGRVLYTLGNVAQENGTSQRFNLTNPTDVAVAPNGDIYVVDGYGSQLVHRFDKDFRPIRTIGGRGNTHGQFNVCHGVWVSTLRSEPEIWIADRANNRIEIYTPALDYRRTIGDVRLPCCFYQHDGHMYVPELGARVSVIDAQDRIVARLGDGQGIMANQITMHPDKFATPHALTVASNGDLYVLEWLPNGRPRKFRHTPANG